MTEYPAFDLTSATDAMADKIRVKAATLGLFIFNDPNFRALPTAEQIEVMSGGVLTALMCILYSLIEDTSAGHDEVEMFVTAYIPQARAQAEGIAASGETRQ